MFNFEKLEVWRRSVAFAGTIYRTTRVFPADERFGLTNQIRRTANSISSNLAEGSAHPPADNARFVGYAAGSFYEVVSQTAIARTEGLVSADDFADLYGEAEEISRILSGLRKSLE